ncbi:MAG: FHA domain-containing protein, partial [Gemmatimonadales bacterium]|nr:FHA domain-containing protein [Gemmatimonadales bacterium]
MNAPDPSRTTAGIRVQIAGGERVWSFDRPFTIGREPGNDVVVLDGLVSQRHAEVTLLNGAWHIHDLGSTNGTFIDGRQVSDGPVRPPARVTLGRNGPTLHFTSSVMEDAARETVAVPPPRASELAERYLGERPPEDMGPQTAKIRRLAAQDRRERAKKYVIAISVLTVVA